jgi:hypothetical protein
MTKKKDTSDKPELKSLVTSSISRTSKLLSLSLRVGADAEHFIAQISKAKNKLTDLVGMGICFSAPLYQENTGTAAAPVMVNRWNRWNITIIPYFFTRSPNGKDTADQLLSKIMMSPEQLSLASDSQLGPSMRIMNSSVAPFAGP